MSHVYPIMKGPSELLYTVSGEIMLPTLLVTQTQVLGYGYQ